MTEHPKWDRRLWSRIAAWLLLVMLACGALNLWQTAVLLQEVRLQRARSEARLRDFAAFRDNVNLLAGNADQIHMRSLAELQAMRADVAVLKERVKVIESVSPVQAIKDRAHQAAKKSKEK